MKVDEWTILPEISLFHGSDVLTSNWTFGIASGPNRCQAPGATPGRMLAHREPESVPGTRCKARSMLANREPKSVPGTGCNARSMLANRVPESVPGTGCEARLDASKQGAQIGAWHEWYCTPVVATCRQTVEALLAPLSTAWQRMASAPVKAIE